MVCPHLSLGVPRAWGGVALPGNQTRGVVSCRSGHCPAFVCCASGPLWVGADVLAGGLGVLVVPRGVASALLLLAPPAFHTRWPAALATGVRADVRKATPSVMPWSCVVAAALASRFPSSHPRGLEETHSAVTVPAQDCLCVWFRAAHGPCEACGGWGRFCGVEGLPSLLLPWGCSWPVAVSLNKCSPPPECQLIDLAASLPHSWLLLRPSPLWLPAMPCLCPWGGDGQA